MTLTSGYRRCERCPRIRPCCRTGAFGRRVWRLKSSNRFELRRLQSPADTAAAMAAITAAVAAGEIMLGEAAKLVERLFRLVGKLAG